MKFMHMGRRTIDGMDRSLVVMMNDRVLRSTAAEMLLSKIDDFTHLQGISSNSISYAYNLNSDKNSHTFYDYDAFVDLDLPEKVTWKYFRNALFDPYVMNDDVVYTRFTSNFLNVYDIHMEQVRSSYKKRKRNGKIFKQKRR